MNIAGRYFHDQAALPRPYAGQLTASFQQALAQAYAGFTPADCHFTHSLHLPGGQIIPGMYELHGAEEASTGNMPLWGKRVLEYLPGAGGLSNFLAARADELIVLDHAPGLLTGAAEEQAERSRRGWWFAKAALGFEAQAAYADLNAPPADLGRFDVAVLNGVFSNLQHPFLALQGAARLADVLVVIEPAYPEETRPGAGAPPTARFIPATPEGAEARWQYSRACLMLMLASAGFAEQDFSIHTLPAASGVAVPHLTIIARRSASRQLQVSAAAPPPQPAQPAPLMPPPVGGSPADELPLPTAAGRFSVAGTADVEAFVLLGRAGFAALRDSLARAGTSPASLGRILDFGCGVGRVLRYWYGQAGVEMHGTDLNPDSIAWCRENLAFASFATNGLAPQLNYPDGYFGFLYALSVFTHLPEDIQLPWLRELARIVRPGGLIYFTTHGDSYRAALPAALRERYDRNEFVSGGDDQPGSNYCGTFHPPAFVRGHLLAPLGLELVEFLPQGAAGNPTQDSWLVRKTAP